jgi:hypothetical protein
MNSKAIYICPFYPPNSEKLFNDLNGFSKTEISLLSLTLYLNILENLAGKEDKIDIYCIWDESEKVNLPNELKNNNNQIIFTDISNKRIIFEKLSSKEFLSYKSNLIVFSDVIDIRPSDYEQYYNLINKEADSLLIAKNKSDSIAVFGFNKYSEEIMNSLLLSNFNYNDFLGRNDSCTHFMHIVNDILLIRNIDDFKKLYTGLSQKKSVEYCSQQMHERFTHLFVEYKDLLK